MIARQARVASTRAAEKASRGMPIGGGFRRPLDEPLERPVGIPRGSQFSGLLTTGTLLPRPRTSAGAAARWGATHPPPRRDSWSRATGRGDDRNAATTRIVNHGMAPRISNAGSR